MIKTTISQEPGTKADEMILQPHYPKLIITFLCAAMLAACGAAPPDGPGANGNNATNNPMNNPTGDALEPPGEVRQGSLNREENPDVDAATLAELTAGNRDMAFNLLAQLRQEEGDEANVFVSPLVATSRPPRARPSTWTSSIRPLAR